MSIRSKARHGVRGQTVTVKSSFELLQTLLEGVKNASELLVQALRQGIVELSVPSDVGNRMLRVEVAISADPVAPLKVGHFKLDLLSALFRLAKIAYRPRRRFLISFSLAHSCEAHAGIYRVKIPFSTREEGVQAHVATRTHQYRNTTELV